MQEARLSSAAWRDVSHDGRVVGVPAIRATALWSGGRLCGPATCPDVPERAPTAPMRDPRRPERERTRVRPLCGLWDYVIPNDIPQKFSISCSPPCVVVRDPQPRIPSPLPRPRPPRRPLPRPRRRRAGGGPPPRTRVCGMASLRHTTVNATRRVSRRRDP